MSEILESHRSSRPRRNMLTAALVIVDSGAIALALALALYIRYSSGLWLRHSQLDLQAFLLFSALVVPIYLVLLSLHDLYDHDYALAGRGRFGRLAAACTLGLVAVVFWTFLVEEQLSRGAVLLTWIFSTALLGTGRWAVASAVAFLRRRGRMSRRVLIVGVDAPTLALVGQMAHGNRGTQVVGFLDDFQPAGTSLLNGFRVVGDPTRLEEWAQHYAVDEVVVSPTAVTWESLQGVLAFASRHRSPRVRLLPGLYDALTTGVKITYEGQIPMMALEPLSIRGPEAVTKRLTDYIVALSLSPLVLAVIGIAWVGSLLDGAGPPLAATTVLGRGGRTFGLLSLRRPPQRSRAWSWRNRMAGSRLGKLPALLNVLAGHLSLVGPRAMPSGQGSPVGTFLSQERPGLTGPWRFPEKEYKGSALPPEVEYVQRYSLWLDLRLLLGSLRRLLLRQQAVPLLGELPTDPRITVALHSPEQPESMPLVPQEEAAR